MSLKEFIKSLSIYGILPVFTKFASFLLVPIYVRVFSAREFGIVELIVSSASFVIFLINLEFYGAVGRYFFECESLTEKRKLISTGLLMTLLMAITVLCVGMLLQKEISLVVFSKIMYLPEIRLGLVWAVFSAISTYLSVLPRYLKKAKVFVLYNAVSFTVKLLSTIFFVVVLKLGVAGAIWGNLAGAVTATILYSTASISYLRPMFSWAYLKSISAFSLPLVPGLLLTTLYGPTMRTTLARVYSLEHLGLFSFATKIVTVMALFETSMRMSWKPMLYENIGKKYFGDDYLRISTFMGKVLLAMGILIAAFSPELIHIIGTAEYFDASKLVGILLIGNIFKNLNMLRGFGFEVAKKTYLLSIVRIVTFIVGLTFLRYISPLTGIVGIGIAFALPAVINYIICFRYTQKVINREDRYTSELWLWIILLATSALLSCGAAIQYRVFSLLLMMLVLKPWKDAVSIQGKLRDMLSSHD